jgi:hypothetical protein
MRRHWHLYESGSHVTYWLTCLLILAFSCMSNIPLRAEQVSDSNPKNDSRDEL